MPEASYFTEFLIVLLVATVVAILFERLRLPPILGFLIAGVVIGPNGLRLISDLDRIYQLAELGMILLMFTIGLGFSFQELRGLKKIAILGGLMQIIVSVVLAMGFAKLAGWTPYEGFVLGSVMALSSTAIVLKFLIDRGDVDSHYGRIAIAILVFQDLAVLPLVILVTALGQSAGTPIPQLLVALSKAALFLGGGILFARLVFFKFIHWVAMSRSREIFLLTTVVVAFGMAWVSNQLGLTLAIGAFLAGLMFANTEYGHQIAGDIMPFRHIFVSLFFVSLGVIFDISFAWEHFALIGIVVLTVLVANFFVTASVVLSFGYPPRVALATGIIIAQMGEFSFLLLEAGRSTGSIEPFFYQVLLSSAFLTMVLTPLLFAMLPHILRYAMFIPIFGMPPTKVVKSQVAGIAALREHIILCGYGPVGRDLAVAIEEEGLPFVVVEMNPERIREAKFKKHPVLYGDAANEEVMRKAGIEHARAVVLSFGDSVGVYRMVPLIQRLNGKPFLLVRTRFEREVPYLYELGVDAVVMEELEASLELNRILLELFKVESGKINKYLDRIRQRKEVAIEEAIFRRTQETGG